MNKKIGITGCTGSLGKFLVKKKNLSFSCFKGDIRKKRDIKKWLSKNDFDAIIHLAAIVPIKLVNKNKTKSRNVNYYGTKYLVEEIKKTNLKWFFFASTSHVYKSSKKRIKENAKTDPISFYGKTKLDAENLIEKNFRKTKTKFCIGRIFSTSNVNQKKDYLVPDLIKKIRYSKNKIILKNLNHYRDFISMEEISKIILELYRKRCEGIINIGRGKGIYLKDIANFIIKKFNKKCEFIDNKKPTYLISNNSRLRKFVKIKKINGLKKLIL